MRLKTNEVTANSESLPSSWRNKMGRVAARMALVASGAALALTGGATIEANTGHEAVAHADGNAYDEFSKRSNSAERSWCRVPSRIRLCHDIMKKIGDEATESAEYVVNANGWDPSELHNGRADAFRHCFFMAKVTRVHGVDTAREFGNRHEEGVPDGFPPQDPAEKAMDLQNNIEGRRIGVTEGSIFNRCVDAARSGQLVTIQ